ncbi:MAG: hypothetical protein PWQ70_570 [Clostridiales bacterium]|jgi:outer membrane biosynthesis protein TonB|nr:hypothetical protein [Clostridiales bacterium]
MKRLNEKTKKNLIVLSLVIIIALLGYGITNSLKTQQTSDELISDKYANTVVDVQAIEGTEEAEANDEITETEVPEINIMINDKDTANQSEDTNTNENSNTEDAKPEPPSEKPDLEPPKEKPETVPPEELLKENPEYISSADLEDEETESIKSESVESTENHANSTEENEESNLVPENQNPFIGAGENTVIDDANGSDYYQDGIPAGQGDKF